MHALGCFESAFARKMKALSCPSSNAKQCNDCKKVTGADNNGRTNGSSSPWVLFLQLQVAMLQAKRDERELCPSWLDRCKLTQRPEHGLIGECALLRNPTWTATRRTTRWNLKSMKDTQGTASYEQFGDLGTDLFSEAAFKKVRKFYL